MTNMNEKLKGLSTFEHIASLEDYLKLRASVAQSPKSDEANGIQNPSKEDEKPFKGNIENYFGMAEIPMGLAGPLFFKGKSGAFAVNIPLATTEGALVASYNRGMKACAESGIISSICIKEGVQRSPFFKFETLKDALRFSDWVQEKLDIFNEICKQSSRIAQVKSIKTNIEGNALILILDFYTGDAAGQNMVTIATKMICKYILKNMPTQPTVWYIESNFSGDKKATFQSFQNVRGKKVSAEIVLKRDVIKNTLKTTPELMEAYWINSTMAAVKSGSIGAQGHVANGLTALFIATGQDVACVSEAAIGMTRMEITQNGDLYVAVTLPSLIVGTVGGGTHLPSQRACLEMMDAYGTGKAIKFAEICAAVALAGEISIAAAISAGHFTDAHKRLGRR